MWKLGIFLAVTLGGGLLTAIGRSLKKAGEDLETPLEESVRQNLVEKLSGELKELHRTQEELAKKRKELLQTEVRKTRKNPKR